LTLQAPLATLTPSPLNEVRMSKISGSRPQAKATSTAKKPEAHKKAETKKTETKSAGWGAKTKVSTSNATVSTRSSGGGSEAGGGGGGGWSPPISSGGGGGGE